MSIKKVGLVFAQTSPVFLPIYAFLYGLISFNYYFIFYGVLSFVNSILNFILKVIFRFVYEKIGNNNGMLPILGRGMRPPGAYNCGVIPTSDKSPATSFGMPSGHSQSVWFMFGFFILYFLKSNVKNQNKNKNEKPWTFWVGLKLSLLLIFCMFISSSRIYVGCHTVQQVIIGGIIGFFFGLSCFTLTNYIIKKYITQ
jgi:membrane-associated phospholipid phosphatase